MPKIRKDIFCHMPEFKKGKKEPEAPVEMKAMDEIYIL